MKRRNDESGQRRVVKAACSQLQQFWGAFGFRKEKAWFNSRWSNALRTAAEVVVSEHTMVLVRVWSRDSWFRRSRYRRQIKTAIEFRSSNGRNLKIWSIISSLIWWFHCSSRCARESRVSPRRYCRPLFALLPWYDSMIAELGSFNFSPMFFFHAIRGTSYCALIIDR
jgi:hypothetical protein